MGRRSLPKTDPQLDLSYHHHALDDLPSEAWEPQTLFDEPRPLEVEIGSGKGLFLTSAASQRSDRNFLGIELAKKYARFAAARLAKAEVSNAVVLQGDGLQLLHRLATASVHAVHVYFPDPWWKKRHRKRRVMNESCVRDIERVLVDDGRLHFWTDVEEYFQSTVELIRSVSQLDGPIAVAAREASHSLDYQTHFERRMRLAGLPVYRAEYIRR